MMMVMGRVCLEKGREEGSRRMVAHSGDNEKEEGMCL